MGQSVTRSFSIRPKHVRRSLTSAVALAYRRILNLEEFVREDVDTYRPSSVAHCHFVHSRVFSERTNKKQA